MEDELRKMESLNVGLLGLGFSCGGEVKGEREDGSKVGFVLRVVVAVCHPIRRYWRAFVRLEPQPAFGRLRLSPDSHAAFGNSFNLA